MLKALMLRWHCKTLKMDPKGFWIGYILSGSVSNSKQTILYFRPHFSLNKGIRSELHPFMPLGEADLQSSKFWSFDGPVTCKSFQSLFDDVQV
jgi:hypothetical protein